MSKDVNAKEQAEKKFNFAIVKLEKCCINSMHYTANNPF